MAIVLSLSPPSCWSLALKLPPGKQVSHDRKLNCLTFALAVFKVKRRAESGFQVDQISSKRASERKTFPPIARTIAPVAWRRVALQLHESKQIRLRHQTNLLALERRRRHGGALAVWLADEKRSCAAILTHLRTHTNQLACATIKIRDKLEFRAYERQF